MQVGHGKPGLLGENTKPFFKSKSYLNCAHKANYVLIYILILFPRLHAGVGGAGDGDPEGPSSFADPSQAQLEKPATLDKLPPLAEPQLPDLSNGDGRAFLPEQHEN